MCSGQVVQFGLQLDVAGVGLFEFGLQGKHGGVAFAEAGGEGPHNVPLFEEKLFVSRNLAAVFFQGHSFRLEQTDLALEEGEEGVVGGGDDGAPGRDGLHHVGQMCPISTKTTAVGMCCNKVKPQSSSGSMNHGGEGGGEVGGRRGGRGEEEGRKRGGREEEGRRWGEVERREGGGGGIFHESWSLCVLHFVTA